eukprot:TRINITY_DN29538_c0_g1_i1.p2 TRINITY_DN29538_c0_g1~~TRINITY_DN29538_c0_g1_i1.p2  ORF type:complete len:115 (-),score=3.84 TRINITY_DN29538_c0_g1_i1:434-778(-)
MPGTWRNWCLRLVGPAANQDKAPTCGCLLSLAHLLRCNSCGLTFARLVGFKQRALVRRPLFKKPVDVVTRLNAPGATPLYDASKQRNFAQRPRLRKYVVVARRGSWQEAQMPRQ